MIFIFLILCIGIISILYLKNKQFKALYCFLIGIVLVLISAFRSEWVGTDTHSYVQGFRLLIPELHPIEEIFERKEFLFYLYQRIVRSFTANYTYFLIFPAVFYICAVCHFINRHSSSPAISFLLFLSMGYFSFSMAGMRQTIAIGFLIFATEFLLDKKFVRCILLILVASGFHITSLIYFLIFILYYLPLNKWFVGLIAVFSAFIYFRGENFVFTLVDWIWGDSRSYTQEFGGTSTLWLLVLVSIATLIFYKTLLPYRKLRKSEPDAVLEGDLLFTKMLILSVPFQLMAIYQANAFRVAMLFHFPMIALLPNVIASQPDLRVRTLAKVFVVFCLLYQLFFITYWIAGIIPYSFFWQG